MPKEPKVTFINCPIREASPPNNPPLGILYLVGQLKACGYNQVSMLDLNVKRNADGSFLTEAQAREALVKHLESNGEPDFVGLSGLITTLKWQKWLAKTLRELLPNAVIASGGGLATEFDGNLFQWIPELDAICVGEGESVIEDMVASCGKPGKKVYHGVRNQSMDFLPLPDFTVIPKEELEKYIAVPVWGGLAKNSSSTSFESKRSLSLISSRGCPFSCKFCYRKMQGGREYGTHSASRVAGEMLSLYLGYHLDFVGIIDDNFTANKERVKKICSLLDGENIAWGTHGRMDMADERLEWMAQTGCKYLGFGAESASANVLKSMGKGGKIVDSSLTKTLNEYSAPGIMVEAIKKCLAVGIHPNCTWIMGFPGESLEDLKISVAFILWQKGIYPSPESVNQRMFVATAYPGTEMFSMPVVREKLGNVFGIKFDEFGQPVFNESLENYVLQLDDATKLIGNGKEILNYSAMPDDIFLQAKKFIENGEIENILHM